MVHRLLVLGHDGASPHLRGVESERFRNPVEVDLEGKPGLRRAVAALRAAGRLVREDAAPLELVPRDPVGHRLERARVEGGRDPVRAVRPPVEPRPEVKGQDLAVLPHAGPHPHEHRMAAPVGIEDLLPRERRLHRSPRDLGQPGDDHLVAEGVGLPAEAAAVRGRDDPDVAHRHLEDLAERPVDIVRRLGRGPERELPVRRPLGDRRMLLHRQVRVSLEEEHVLADEVGLAETLLHVAELERDQLVDVVPVPVLVDTVGARPERRLDGHQRIERLVLDVDHPRGGFGGLFVHGGDGRHRVSHEAHLLHAERLFVLAHRHDPEPDWRKVPARDDRVHAGQGRRARRVDPTDQGMRALRPEELRVRHAREDDVVGEARLACHLRPGIDLGQPVPDD